MFNQQTYHYHSPPLLRLAHLAGLLELAWPFPLIFAGILRILDLRLISAALALALLPWLARTISLGRVTRSTFIGGPLLLLLASGLLSMGAAYDPALSWPMLLTLLGSTCLFFAIINAPVSSLWLSRGLVLAASLAAFYFVGQYGHFDYSQETSRLVWLGQLTGSFMPNLAFATPQLNAMAGFLEGPFLLSLALAWRARRYERLLWSLAAALLAYGLLISDSRGSWVGLVVALGLWLLLQIPNLKLRLALTAAAGIADVLAVYSLSWLAVNGYQLPALTSASATAHSRLVLYKNSLHLLGDYPFTGIGLGGVFSMIFSRYQLMIGVPFLAYSHNLYLLISLRFGLLGVVAFAWLLVSFYYFVGRVERAGLKRRALLFQAAWLGVTVMLIHGLTDAPRFADSGWPMPVLFALLSLTIVLGRAGLRPNRPKKRRKAYRRELVALAATSLVFITSIVVIFHRPLLAAWYANLGAVHQTRADLAPDLPEAVHQAETATAVAYFEQALAWSPDQTTANRRLGQIALDQGRFDIALTHLARAYAQDPYDQATLKALGFAYLWTGQLDQAERLLRQRDDLDKVAEELDAWWSWWWGTQNQPDRAAWAREMAQRLGRNR